MEKNLIGPPTSSKRRQKKVEHDPPETIQDYSNQRTGNHDVNFTRKMEAHTLPVYKNALSYLTTLDNPPSYVGNTQNMIVNSQYLKFPEMDTLSRVGYLLDFMREASSRANERPCSRHVCQSQVMGKFKCRELILPRKGREANAGWCIMCHYHETNRLYNENYDTVVNHPIHAFMVFVDLPGEYKLSRTILGEELKDDKMHGIFGPFPLFHIDNYKASETPNGLKCWIEDEKNLVSTSPG